LRSICEEVRDAGRDVQHWAGIESDDMFQTDSYCGGFDATEMAFTFSYYDSAGKEFWFQLTLEEVVAVANGANTEVELRPAE
jgi:hypothetical protein